VATVRSISAGAATVLVAAGLYAASPAAADPPGIPVVGDGAARPSGSHSSTAAPRAAATATTLGQPGANPISCTGIATAGSMLATRGATGPTYTAGADGVLTSFTHVANASPGQVRAVVFGDTGTASEKAVVARSPFQTVTVSTENTFPIRVPIKAGQHLGMGMNGLSMACGATGVAGDVIGVSGPFDADTQTLMAFTNQLGSFRPNIFAVVEPDADGDGFGDVSQDQCTQSKLTQGACPAPDTDVTKKPKKKSTKRKGTFKFTATVPGSTFTCAVDKKPAEPCTSPFKKKFTYGKHTVVITAISPFGLVDATPETVRFKVTRPA
jgi:hypothetical protein